MLPQISGYGKHFRKLDSNGERAGSLQCGAACSTEAPAAMFSQACCRQRKVKGAAGASQSGKIVKVLWHGRQIPRRTQMRSWRSSWAWRGRCPWPMIVWSRQTGHRLGRRSKGITPKSMLFFASGSAIKRITAGVKARRDRSLLKFRSAGRAFTLRQSQFQTKKEYCFPLGNASPHSGHWPV
jgi:hypothetical protein